MCLIVKSQRYCWPIARIRLATASVRTFGLRALAWSPQLRIHRSISSNAPRVISSSIPPPLVSFIFWEGCQSLSRTSREAKESKRMRTWYFAVPEKTPNPPLSSFSAENPRGRSKVFLVIWGERILGRAKVLIWPRWGSWASRYQALSILARWILTSKEDVLCFGGRMTKTPNAEPKNFSAIRASVIGKPLWIKWNPHSLSEVML